jgi:magnesium-protoporphyrin O-methyltransferase
MFDQAQARRHLSEYQREGLGPLARAMVDYIIERGVAGKSVLEAGGGIGAIQVELLKAGADHAVNVELSDGYEDVAADLIRLEGLEGRVERRLGDFTSLPDRPIADDVVLNRVICCYPDMPRLVGSALDSSRRFVAASFPRDRWHVKAAISIENMWHRLRGRDFRAFVHPVDRIVDIARARGFSIAFEVRSHMWDAMVFERGS